MTKYIYPFGGSAPKPTVDPDKQIVGGKGLGLQVMSKIGVDVPPGFTLTTPLCQVFAKDGDLPPEVWKGVRENVIRIEKDMGKKFGSSKNPLLFSCRSGAAISMPGMMDTVLNIGLNDFTTEGLAKATGNERFAWDSYRRLLDMFGEVVLGIPHEDFEKRFDIIKEEANASNDVDLGVADLKKLCEEYKKVYLEQGKKFPSDPYEQLHACVKAVFGSWMTPRAVKYREINNVKSLLGTATNIQTMVFGNMGDDSGTGVAFSRNPSTGENILYGEYLINAQGEDVVAGIRTPQPIFRMKEVLPAAYDKFLQNVEKLEHYFKDMQDVEFTVEKGKLWMLQCRNGKRTGTAAIKIATDLVKEGICTKSEALLKVEPTHVEQLLHPTFSIEALKSDAYIKGVVAKGLPGSPGAAVGKLVFTPKQAEDLKAKGESVILARETTSPEDVGGMWAAAGILTARGGMTSHAAVVARGWGKPCVCGCSDIVVSEVDETVIVKETQLTFRAGDVISINGATGEVIKNPIEVKIPKLEGELGTLLGWADQEEGVMKVLANADSGPDATQAAGNGAQGIGLCRTEHMFFSPERLPVVRRWIFHNEELDDFEHIKEFQRSDFKELFKAMNNMHVTIRLLDPPLHEFLPRPEQVHEKVAEELGFGKDVKRMLARMDSMHEENPMLGLRGCRLGIVKPEFTKMQAEAIISAAADFMEEAPGIANPHPRIMIPLIGSINEYKNQALIIKREAERIRAERGIDVQYEIGTMIEVPRAAIISDKIANLKDDADGKPLCNFFSYGTNDLTQMTMGISRDDSNGFIPKYLEIGIFDDDPFQTIDEEGVGFMVKHSVEYGRSVNPNISLSVCGEHGGDPKSIAFFDKLGLNYVSCSPYRVPVARLAAGQARVRARMAAAKEEEKKQAKAAQLEQKRRIVLNDEGDMVVGALVQ
mmetsp:Transcript_4059/g.9059  ORF Transcript_4059/g.9059 Transcript_4059/m.9059 type:complete len:932 (+) Transcript_4059:114-2909(+)|eukprot:CAMPEP_0171337328 /NCGR_PEP_ID=MMETSP0878-20121228/6629_1 /TAXON_ID=67004 /ORGANISM="Thalassiosira weissflogii, Strain CCMP1336" /LENGTH=931 /DNA_ID=CAMNT_0011838947 /DNA_START=236 /DNA_END=3031 /DNA_ORIENTATION=+